MASNTMAGFLAGSHGRNELHILQGGGEVSPFAYSVMSVAIHFFFYFFFFCNPFLLSNICVSFMNIHWQWRALCTDTKSKDIVLDRSSSKKTCLITVFSWIHLIDVACFSVFCTVGIYPFFSIRVAITWICIVMLCPIWESFSFPRNKLNTR